MSRVAIEGRKTGMGAYTTAHGRVVSSSKTGRHWVEIVEGPIGKEFEVIDISNSGKHHCFRARITGENEYQIIEEADEYECQFCSRT